ncbi:hypothetical protein X801_06799, partial [Opisthorchis viverrini]
RCGLVDSNTVEHTQDILLETFNRYVNWSRKLATRSPATRTTATSLQYWPRIFMALTELRSITLCNQGLFVEKSFTANIDELPWYFHDLFRGCQSEREVEEIRSSDAIELSSSVGHHSPHQLAPVLMIGKISPKGSGNAKERHSCLSLGGPNSNRLNNVRSVEKP